MNSQQLFHQYFKSSPLSTSRAHGRVNLIGEHTDYNQGYVLPTLIEQYIEVSLSFRNDTKIIGISDEFGEIITDLNTSLDGSWIDFVKGALYYIGKKSHVTQGIDIAVTTSIAHGSGLSSSAALEIALLRALSQLINIDIKPHEMARMGQLIEHKFVGTQCGIMDQMASASAQLGQALFLDCEKLHSETIPIFNEYSFIVLHSGSTRKLSLGQYNERKNETEIASKTLGVPSLRHAKLENLNLIKDDIILRRAKHIITENERVLKASKYLKNQDALSFGKLMYESHTSMKDNYQISSPELDLIVSTAHQLGATGARLTGAGFGGCAIILSDNNKKNDIAKQLIKKCPNSYLVTIVTKSKK